MVWTHPLFSGYADKDIILIKLCLHHLSKVFLMDHVLWEHVFKVKLWTRSAKISNYLHKFCAKVIFTISTAKVMYLHFELEPAFLNQY